MNLITGVGVGLRPAHYEVFLSDNPPDIPWIEILADNYLGLSGISWEKVILISKHYPVVLHCVNCGVGNTDPINWDYCRQIKAMIDVLNPIWVSDHLCWTAVKGHYSHALLPLPFHGDIIHSIVERIVQLQTFFERPFLIENVAAYVRTEHDTLSEAVFMNQIAQQADCGILLDINNLFVNAHNHQESVDTFLAQIDAKRVKQYHMGGHVKDGQWLIDTHSAAINESVLSLYQKTLRMVGIRPTCIEWDSDIPAWPVLANEIQNISRVMV